MSNTSVIATNFLKLLVGSSLALALAACESSGGVRTGGVGSASGEAVAASEDGGSSSTASTDAGGSGGTGSGTASMNADGSSTAGTDADGSDTSAGTGQPRIRTATNSASGRGILGSSGLPLDRSAILVTAGNAVLDVADRADAVRGPLSGNVPNSAPITGTVTQVLASTGQALVRSGDGSSYLVDGLRAAAGSAVTIGAGQATLVGGPGSNPLIGVNVLTPGQTSGTAATLNAATGGNLLGATVPSTGALAGTPGAVADATGGLVNATAGGSQLLGGAPATVGASVLSPTQATGSVLTAGVGSGGQAVTLNGTSVASPATGGGLLGGTGAVGGITNSVGGITGSTGVTGSAGATGNGAANVGPLTLGR